MCRCTFGLLFCIFSLYQLDGVPLKWHGKELTQNYAELTVSGKHLKKCENHRNVCVMDTKDCASITPHGQDRFLNTSCRYHVLQRSFGCKWIYLNKRKAKTINSLIFSQRKNFIHCPNIFNPVAAFNMNIISKDIINQIQFISEAYAVSLKAITQAPCPVITSVNPAVTSLNVTWNTGHWHSTKCQIHYKSSTTEEWTVVLLVLKDLHSINDEEEEYNFSYVIDGLQPFSQYSLAVSCSGGYGLWSDWSEEFQSKTLEAFPTAAPSVSFYVEPTGNRFRRQKLTLIWKALEIKEARGVILEYVVTYTPTKQPGMKRTIRTTDQKATLEMTAGDYNLTVVACNKAGQSPSANLQVSAGVFQSLPKVKGLWASGETFSLKIRWETTAVNVSEFAIEWFSFSDVASKQWKRLNGSTFSTVLTGNIKPQNTYSISVYSLFGTLCAPPETIHASVENGTLLDIGHLQPVKVTKTSVTVKWVWQQQSLTTNVLHYRLVLSGADGTSSITVFPHQWQHSFQNLQTNAKYMVSIYGKTTFGTFLKANAEFTTPLLETDEIIKATLPIVVLIIAFGIFSVLSRSVYKDYFFPKIANPGHSLIGHWLLNSPQKLEAVENVLKLEDFSLNSHLIEKSHIQIEPKMSLDREEFDEDMTISKISLSDKNPIENEDSLENSMPGFTEYVDMPMLHAKFGYVKTCEIPRENK
ncbi:interleukin-6 receptor subunit beta isoform X3 [Silurus meridionalis]|nr:interleukin-6 receptor subunit beta isoform X3 [Silurus meridionalis]XP_046727616.1 interleukin-6 receptor subunit beta isoform X3 [Silurus meridionalis]